VTASSVGDVVAAIAAALVDARDDLNVLDGAAGDGDLGLTAGRAAEALVEIAPTLDAQEPTAAARAIGMALARRAPSTGGTLIAFACLAAAKVDPAGTTGASGLPLLALMLEAARDEVASRGKVAAGDRTMLDALAPAVAAIREAADRGVAIDVALAGAAAAAEAGATATAGMAATTGRAGWLADRALGHEDAGAHLVAIVFGAAAAATALSNPG
jgi:phosphoenolpyruvate---glycerone phosphotransferase subunit DhaL